MSFTVAVDVMGECHQTLSTKSEVCEFGLYNQGFTIHNMGKVEDERLSIVFLTCKKEFYIMRLGTICVPVP
jgi:hypothetical protein